MEARMEIYVHMEVVDADGQHVGVVEKVEGEFITLRRRDAIDPRNLVLDEGQVDHVEDNKIWLSQKVSSVTTRTFLSPDQ
jgi:hypothetical protein